MKFFDSFIDEVFSSLSFLEEKALPYEKKWTDEGHSRVILQRDSAFELKGCGFNLVTSKEVPSGVSVYGEDLPKIKKDMPFTRITLISVEDTDDEQTAYDLIKKIEYVKYHLFPEGYMMRSTSGSNKEAVRISKAALKKGLDFSAVGNMFIEKYKEIPGVKSAGVIFITGETALHRELAEIAEKSSGVTKALNHIMESVNLDCNSCNLKSICDEVDGMRELHFKSSKRMGG